MSWYGYFNRRNLHDEAYFQGPPILSTLATECDHESMEISFFLVVLYDWFAAQIQKVGHLGSDKNGLLYFLPTCDFLSSHFFAGGVEKNYINNMGGGLGYSFSGRALVTLFCRTRRLMEMYFA